MLGTFTLRYPIPCSRFAPYGWVGVGGYFHDNGNNNFVGANFRNNDNESSVMGQFGAGFEVRITPHLGWTNDVSYNLVGDNNDFVQIRTGLNFAF